MFVHFCSFPKDKLILSDEYVVMLRTEQEAAPCLSEWVYGVTLFRFLMSMFLALENDE